MKQVALLADAPPFYEGLHRKYITELADKLDKSYEGAVIDRTCLSCVVLAWCARVSLIPHLLVFRLAHVRSLLVLDGFVLALAGSIL